jgi:hypothetical protein
MVPKQDMSKVLIEHFRRPDHMVKLGLIGELSRPEGYFLFGPVATCFGQSSVQSMPARFSESIPDLLGSVPIRSFKWT